MEFTHVFIGVINVNNINTGDISDEAAAYRLHLKDIFKDQGTEIACRMDAFGALWDNGEECELLKELLFCILTPQSTAHGCWETIESLSSCGLLGRGTAQELVPHLSKARFKNKKAEYLVAARERFGNGGLRDTVASFGTEQEARAWFADTIKGMGYKEASHFLRNIGKGGTLAILDRHILRSLAKAQAIPVEPRSLGPKAYCEIEDRMQGLATVLGIPLGQLDLVIWYDAKHEIFK